MSTTTVILMLALAGYAVGSGTPSCTAQCSCPPQAGSGAAAPRSATVSCADPGWVEMGNGYQYKMTTEWKAWSDTRKACSDMGAQLVTKGVRNATVRQKLITQFASKYPYVWIGMHDILGYDWYYIDGVKVTDQNGFWAPGQPDGWGGAACGALSQQYNYQSDDGICTDGNLGICEKPVNCPH